MLTQYGQKILDKCREHIASGGHVVWRRNGIEQKMEGKEILWDFSNDLHCCCPLATMLVGKPARSPFIAEEVAFNFQFAEQYAEGFMWGFDEPDTDEPNDDHDQDWYNGMEDAREIRRILFAEGHDATGMTSRLA